LQSSTIFVLKQVRCCFISAVVADVVWYTGTVLIMSTQLSRLWSSFRVYHLLYLICAALSRTKRH